MTKKGKQKQLLTCLPHVKHREGSLSPSGWQSAQWQVELTHTARPRARSSATGGAAIVSVLVGSAVLDVVVVVVSSCALVLVVR